MPPNFMKIGLIVFEKSNERHEQTNEQTNKLVRWEYLLAHRRNQEFVLDGTLLLCGLLTPEWPL